MSVTPKADRAIAIQALRPILRTLAKSPVEVLLPKSLHELSIEHLTAQPPKITANGYRIDLDRAPGCFERESEACAYGSISAGTIDRTLLGQSFQVKIGSQSVTAHYTPVACGGSCGSTHVDFDYRGHRYRFAIKGGDVFKLRVMVSRIVSLREF